MQLELNAWAGAFLSCVVPELAFGDLNPAPAGPAQVPHDESVLKWQSQGAGAVSWTS